MRHKYPGRWFPCRVDSGKDVQTLPRVVTKLIDLKTCFVSYTALMKSTHSWSQNNPLCKSYFRLCNLEISFTLF